MKFGFARFLCAALSAVALSSGSPARAQDSAPAGNADKGKQLFAADGCYECHGYVGQGSVTAGVRIAPMALPFDAFKQQLRSPSNEMPPYTEAVLSDASAADIYAFLKTIQPPAQAAKDIPILNN
jgi:mono/diheme cytochrome c family protein